MAIKRFYNAILIVKSQDSKTREKGGRYAKGSKMADCAGKEACFMLSVGRGQQLFPISRESKQTQVVRDQINARLRTC